MLKLIVPLTLCLVACVTTPPSGDCEINATMHPQARLGDGVCDVDATALTTSSEPMTVSLVDSHGVVVETHSTVWADTTFPGWPCEPFTVVAVPRDAAVTCQTQVKP